MQTRVRSRSAGQLAHPGVVCDQVLNGDGGIGGLTQVSNHTCRRLKAQAPYTAKRSNGSLYKLSTMHGKRQ